MTAVVGDYLIIFDELVTSIKPFLILPSIIQRKVPNCFSILDRWTRSRVDFGPAEHKRGTVVLCLKWDWLQKGSEDSADQGQAEIRHNGKSLVDLTDSIYRSR